MFLEVIFSDKHFALMHAIRVVFPETSNLLCQFDINKNAKEKCKMLTDSRKAWDVIMDAWGNVIDCGDCDVFEGCVKWFECVC